MDNILITGGAGFVGSHLIARLLDLGHRVICVDNYTLGSPRRIERYIPNERFTAYESDASDTESICDIAKRHEISYVFHLAANSDIQKSAANPTIDYHDTFSTSYSVLECMRRCGIGKLFFASTSAVYGEKPGELLSEDAGGLAPISYYGAAKLASEAFISAYAYMNELDVTVFRFPNVIGSGLTHGVVFDFLARLKEDPSALRILGDGTQRKPYLYVHDLIDAIILVAFSGGKGVGIYNVGVESSTSVSEIADMVCERLGLDNTKYLYTGGDRGWKGDIPIFEYSLDKIHTLGWRPKHTSSQAIRKTLDSIGEDS